MRVAFDTYVARGGIIPDEVVAMVNYLLCSGHNILHFWTSLRGCLNVLLTVTNTCKLQVEISSVKEHLVSAGVETRLL